MTQPDPVMLRERRWAIPLALALLIFANVSTWHLGEFQLYAYLAGIITGAMVTAIGIMCEAR